MACLKLPLGSGTAERHLSAGRLRVNYDVTSDDQRFVMIQEGGTDSEATQINVVLNWFEELKQRVLKRN